MSKRRVDVILGWALLVGFLGSGCHLEAAQPEPGKDKAKSGAEPFSPYAYLLSTDQSIQFFQ